jgi:hypothetical protein
MKPKSTVLIAYCRYDRLSFIAFSSEPFADGFQFPPTFRGGLGICHLKRIERVENNLGNNQPGIFLIIGGNDVPGRVMGAGRAQASLIGLLVMLPIFPLVNVREAKFPILVRLINALEESLSLLCLRQVKEELDDPGAVAVEMLLHVHDGTISLLPDGFLVAQLFRKPLAEKDFGMHSNNEHLLVIGAIEDANPPAFRETAARAPKKIVFQFLGARLFETENLAALRINPGHDVPDGPVLAGSVQSLKDQQQCITVGRVVKLLQRTQQLRVLFDEFVVSLFRFVNRRHMRRLLFEVHRFSRSHPEIL